MASRDGSSKRRTGPAGQDARSSALEQLRSLKEKGGRRLDTFELKAEDKIYDTLSEADYAVLVAKRRLETKDFVVEDDGLGYGDIGEEEDWEKDAMPDSSDEEDKEGKSKKAKVQKDVKKREGPTKRAKELMAAAAMMGKHQVSSMFRGARIGGHDKNQNGMKVGNNEAVDNILDNVLAEITADDVDREGERRRRGCRGIGMPVTLSSPVPLSSVQQPTPLERIVPNKGNKAPNSKQEPVIRSSVKQEVPVCFQASPHNGQPLKSYSDDIKNEVINDLDHQSNDKQDPFEGETAGFVDPVVTELLPVKSEETGCKAALNAKIGSITEKIEQASHAWQAICAGEPQKTTRAEVADTHEASADIGKMQLDEDGKLHFFLVDAYEEAFGSNAGTVFLFGKVKSSGRYVSCCVIVQNMQRCIFAVPNPSVFPDVHELEKDRESSGKSSRTRLQEMATNLKMEIAQKLMDLDVVKFSMGPVKRSYAFERSDIPSGEHYFLKVSYPFKDAPLPSNLKGEHFTALFGTHTSALELFLIKKKIKGPCWLTISNPTYCPSSSQVSWCKLEVTVDSPKHISVTAPGKSPSEIPQLIVASINIKTVVNQKQNVNEVASASVVFCQRVKVDVPMPQSEWNTHEMLEHFSIIRKLDGGIFPIGFTSEISQMNTKAGSNVYICESSERALLSCLMMKLHQLDPDVLVGHNISGFDLDVILHRLQACKIQSNIWSKIGRLKRSQMPRLTGGGNTFGSGAGPGAMICMAGRLLCDTYLSSRELLKEVSYSLTELSKTQLSRERKEIAPAEVPVMYQSSKLLVELLECGETDAWLSLSLMFHLSVLPLTRQLTNISGNLWSRTLQGARAQRVEYLLLHEFHARKFVVPDKMSNNEKEQLRLKRKSAPQKLTVDRAEEPVEGGDDEHEDQNHGKRRKSPAYMGGLVLEPKKGLYDKYILLLDFNSLYPSIIQEFNICFTTVERPDDGSIPPLPSTDVVGVLPQVLKNLVERRRQVKQWLKKTTDAMKYQQLDIQQQALKLTANSMYGCLGFTNSRFYAKPIAEIITSQGREILQNTVDLVQKTMNFEVIYGDTDSIMVHTGLEDLLMARSIGAKIIKEVNKRYKLLEIDLDGIYKRMLLLKKKKYAAVKVTATGDGTYREVIEQKGLDIVRRDWSLLSKEIGNYCLEQILSGSSKEDVVESIHAQLRKLQEDMRTGQIELEKYVITKTLTKPPEDYPDAKSQPHVQVALRRRQIGHQVGCFAGDTVPYIICCEQGVPGLGIAERARHPDELKKDAGNWIVDIDYYLSQQIHPVVSRLCAPIEGTDACRIADCLGLDSSRFNQRTAATTVDHEALLSSTAILDDEDRYKHCEPLPLLCPQCKHTYVFPGIKNYISLLLKTNLNADGEMSADTTSTQANDPFRCPKCHDDVNSPKLTALMLANQVKMRAEEFIEKYYNCWLKCDDELCGHATRDVTLRLIGDHERGTACPNFPRCNGHLIRQFSEVQLYNQLSHYCRLLDISPELEKIHDSSSRLTVERKLIDLRSELGLAAQTILDMRDKCAFRWVKLSSLCITV